MQRVDLANNLGSGVSWVRFTVTFSDLAAFTTAGAKTLTLLDDPGGNAANPAPFQIPQGGFILCSRVNVTTAFSGGSLSAMTVAGGKTAATTSIFAAKDVFTAAATFDTSGPASALNLNTAYTVILTLTPTGDTLSAATAGSMDIYIGYFNVTTPSA